ncbi:piggyBac transposable element-derived protein 4-like [Periophthalmus magnuspinnatus]|uniref:piggyBac transposable element-derived protein 4-like n=1 Tax=Periophthalmus magnuspinnatus TaxID=409849 RepID=UPI00145AC1DE|nr:piggyBac transposable element-derived protein 4-like [Periophthalmus magnuspinnatus]
MDVDSAEEAVSEGETVLPDSPDMNLRDESSGGHSSCRGGTFRSCTPPSPTSRAWKTEEDPDVALPKLKFVPRRTPGIQAPLKSGTHTPLDIFSRFFDAEVWRLLCSNTNKSAARHQERGRKYHWTDVTPEELKKFIGLLLYMGVMNLPKMTDFWRKQTIFEVLLPATVMTRDRFKSILSFFHISDPEEDGQNDLARGTEKYDVLHRVQPLLEMLRTHCMAVYHPRQHISVDERMVATKARLSFKQYMRDKPTKWGLKFFVLVDKNGYTVEYQLYTGNPLLFRHLGQQGFGACGTYRQGRIGVPTTTENALTKRSPRGSIRWLRDGDLLFVKWMDTREVSMCTNVHSVYAGETVLRWRKKADGTYERVPIPRPTAVGEYNRYMGGVDTSDQLLGTNTVHRKTRRWYITVFQHMLDMAVTNSFIIFKEMSTIRGERPPTRQDFQEMLTSQLLGVPLKTKPKVPTSNHLPVPTSSGQSKRQKASMGRRQCVLCRRCTPWQCEECKVGLCLQVDRNCFRMYHTLPESEQ